MHLRVCQHQDRGKTYLLKVLKVGSVGITSGQQYLLRSVEIF